MVFYIIFLYILFPDFPREYVLEKIKMSHFSSVQNCTEEEKASKLIGSNTV